MKKRVWVVRVVLFKEQHYALQDRLLECLHRSNVITVHKDDVNVKAFDLWPPMGCSVSGSRLWAESTAEYWRSHGFNASACYAFDDYEYPKKET